MKRRSTRFDMDSVSLKMMYAMAEAKINTFSAAMGA
jgi:hypothetical protein